MVAENIVPSPSNINKFGYKKQLCLKTTVFIKILWSYFNMTFCIKHSYSKSVYRH